MVQYAKQGEDVEQSSKQSLQFDPENATLEEKINRANEMLSEGKSPSAVYRETGLVVMANGNLQDGIGGAIVRESEKNDIVGQTIQNIVGTASGRETSERPASNDRRGTVSARDKVRGKIPHWSELTAEQQAAIEESIWKNNRHNSILEDLNESFFGDTESMPEFLYRKYQEYSRIQFEQEFDFVNWENLDTAIRAVSEDIDQSAYQTEKPLSNRDILEMAAGQIEVEGLTDQQKQALQNFKDRLRKMNPNL